MKQPNLLRIVPKFQQDILVPQVVSVAEIQGLSDLHFKVITSGHGRKKLANGFQSQHRLVAIVSG